MMPIKSANKTGAKSASNAQRIFAFIAPGLCYHLPQYLLCNLEINSWLNLRGWCVCSLMANKGKPAAFAVVNTPSNCKHK